MRTAFFILVLLCSVSTACAAEPVVEDIFGRRLNEHGLVLADWAGEIANPAIKFFVAPPADAVFPVQAVLTAREPRIYFNLPSEIGAGGPRKVIQFKKWEKLPVLVSVFSQRGGKDEDYALELELQDARGHKQALKLPCHIVCQNEKDPRAFPITIDFTQDRTGFFDDPKKREVVTQAARDWVYFFSPLPLDPVAADKESTIIWEPFGFTKSRRVVNAHEYTGYLLYAYGIHSAELRSGGEPSRDGGLQSQQGKQLLIHSSGGVEIEVQGNYNVRGWLVSLDPDDFWKATNLQDVQNDLYSIGHHEIGHSLIFNPANPLFAKAKKAGKLSDPAVKEYLGVEPKIDQSDHLAGTVDPASRRGAYGNEYHGEMPQCRWQITKLDLLCAQAIGYRLRQTSAFAPLTLQTETLPDGTIGKNFSVEVRAVGGIPFYNWEVTAGSLPAGISLSSFTGAISGIPAKAGASEFTIRVRDYDEKTPGKSRTLRLQISGG